MKVDDEYKEYCFNCRETNTTPLPFSEWLDQYIEEREIK